MFHFISLHFSRLIDTLFTNLLIINITEACDEGIKSSDDKKIQNIQTQTCLIKVMKTGSTSFLTAGIKKERALAHRYSHLIL